jgi:hypothetical protein
VGGVVPQQVVGPAARLAQRVHVAAAEEVGLHVHLLDVELAGSDLLVDPLVAGVEAPGVAAHGDQAGDFSRPGTTSSPSLSTSHSGISTCTCLPALQAGQGLAGVHLGWGAEDDRV